jgi:hypothetical protein
MTDNSKKKFPDNLIEFIKSPFGIYLLFIFLIILFPPIDWYLTPKNISFLGWNFITALGDDNKINIVYFLGEIGIVTLVYFIYLHSKKK